jgi:hypothetical protein
MSNRASTQGATWCLGTRRLRIRTAISTNFNVSTEETSAFYNGFLIWQSDRNVRTAGRSEHFASGCILFLVAASVFSVITFIIYNALRSDLGLDGRDNYAEVRLSHLGRPLLDATRPVP